MSSDAPLTFADLDKLDMFIFVDQAKGAGHLRVKINLTTHAAVKVPFSNARTDWDVQHIDPDSSSRPIVHVFESMDQAALGHALINAGLLPLLIQ